MKKFILGTLFGALLISATAYADDLKLMIGKSVDGTFPVFVNGKLLSVEAVVIEGTSYAPVRVIAESIGLKVEFDQKEGVLLNKPAAPTESQPVISNESRLIQIDWEVSRLQSEVIGLKEALKFFPNDPQIEEWKRIIATNETKIEQLQREKEELGKK